MTDLGVLGAGRLGAVDAAGGLAPTGAAWSLRWWVGAEDRWHVPPVEATVRQSLVDDAPVVETRVRVVGGDVVHRAFGAVGPGGASALVVEITNETPVPVAVALVVDGAVGVEVVDDRMQVADGHTIRLPRAPSEWVPPAAFLPLPHRATLRVAVAEGAEAPDPTGLPDAERVAAGWRAQSGAGTRLVIPDPALTPALAAACCFLLLHDAPDRLASALVGEARAAFGAPCSDRARWAVVGRQRRSGAIPDGTGSRAATGQALVALGVSSDPDLVGPVAKAAHWIDGQRRARRHRHDPRRAGLLPAGPQPPIVGGDDQAHWAYWDDWWSIAGLSRAAALLEGEGQVEAAADARRFAGDLAAAVARSVAVVTEGAERPAIPAGPDRPLDAAAVGVVVAAALGAADPSDPAVAATLDLVRAEGVVAGLGVRGGGPVEGWSPWLTALLARVEVATGDHRGLDRLRGLAARSGGRAAWPALVDGPDVAADPHEDHDPRATAAFLLAARALLVVERGPLPGPPDRLAVLPVFPPDWVGQGIELHDAPTAFGRFGFAVRWHGERPALLWDLDQATPGHPFRLEAPGLDPAWSSTDPSGEALLAPHPLDVPGGSLR